MIKVIFAPGGGGKSFFQMHVIVRQLRETRRNIVTNLAIKVPEFNAYLEHRFPDESLNLVGRLRVLTPSETYEFWRYRGPMKWTGNEYEYEEDKGVYGVCYVIDEAGVSGFSATGWAAKLGQGTRGERCLWYLDQQRKFGDDVFASTNGRTPEQIAKPFRDKAHGFIKLKNEYIAQYGPFRGRGRFVWKEFTEEPRKTSEPVAMGKFQIDGLADCYRTQDGVGITGNNADIGARAKGIPILWVIPAALAVASLCVLIPWMLGKGVQSFVGGKAPAAETLANPTATPTTTPAAPPPPVIVSPTQGGLYVTGVMRRGGSVWVSMSDGTRRWYDASWPAESDRITAVTPSRVVVDGQSYLIMARPRQEAPGAAVQIPPEETGGGQFPVNPPVDLLPDRNASTQTGGKPEREEHGDWYLEDGVYRLRGRSSLANTYRP